MMWLRLTIRLALGFSAGFMLLAGLLWAFDQRPPGTLADYPGFDVCTLPCWAGIALSQTRTQDVFASLTEKLPEMQVDFRAVMTQIGFTATGPTAHLTGIIYDDRGQVGGLQLELDMPFWKLVEALDTPGCVRTYPSPDGRLIVVVVWALGDYYVNASLFIPPSESLRPSDTAVAMAILKRTDICTEPNEHPWRGFAPIWFYRSR